MAEGTFQGNTSVDIKNIINYISQLNSTELDKFKHQIDQLWWLKKEANVSEKELAIIKEIESQFTTKERKRLALLVEKTNAETITTKEREEALALFEKGQGDYLRRLEAAERLATFRKVELSKIIAEFGLLNPANV